MQILTLLLRRRQVQAISMKAENDGKTKDGGNEEMVKDGDS
ncbi:MAG: hypothetical protein ACP5KV_05670 [Candidatus Methanomethylicaceae archaeon]